MTATRPEGGQPGHWWSAPAVLGADELVKGFGGVVPPLIAGFSLATLATLLTADHPPRLATWADTGFIVTAASLLYAMQFSFTALRHWSTPDDRLMWRPDARLDATKLYEERWYQALDRKLFDRYAGRARQWYNFGLTAFTVSIVCLAVPSGAPSTWTIDRLAMFAAAVATVLGELLLIHGQRVPRLRRWVWPEPTDVAAAIERPETTTTTPY